ncbi:hypothetical protein FRC01_000167 [Tulasnella sp. 417]|nr:hypothetical protein FRC01_000167 [Tulasnella sp. 417]
MGPYFHTAPPQSPTPALTALPAPMATSRAEEGDRDARRRSGSHWSSSELSTARLTDNIREAIGLRVGAYKKLGLPTASKKKFREK